MKPAGYLMERETSAFHAFDSGLKPDRVCAILEVSLRTAQRIYDKWLKEPPMPERVAHPPVVQPKRQPLRRCHHCGGTVMLLGDEVRCVNCGRAPLDRVRQAPLI